MDIFNQYALIKAKIVELENQEDALRVKILEEMVERGEEKVETAMGSFKKATLKVWTYTDKVKELEEEYKAEKIKEQNNEEATYVEKASLRYTPIKL